MKKEVYVLKEYNDEYAYGEEVVRVFSNAEDAINALKESFAESNQEYGSDFDEIIAKMKEDGVIDEKDDTVRVEEDNAYISIMYLKGDGCCYWSVDKKEVEDSEETQRCEDLLIKAIEWTVNVSEQHTRDLLRAIGITSDELSAIGYDEENFPKMHIWANE